MFGLYLIYCFLSGLVVGGVSYRLGGYDAWIPATIAICLFNMAILFVVDFD